MKTVYLQVIDHINNGYQTCSISEPVDEGAEIDNALLRFGLKSSDVNWGTPTTYYINSKEVKHICGHVIDAFKSVTLCVVG